MMILLPPSEAKRAPTQGQSLRLQDRLAPLRPPTEKSIAALRDLCASDPHKAVELLGLSSGQSHWLEANIELVDAATAPASQVYTGVLYNTLDVDTLPRSARSRADKQLWVASALFGLVRFDEAIPAYKFSGGVTLPGLPPPGKLWQEPITAVIETEDPAVIVDMRSTAYNPLWRPPEHLAGRYLTVKIWQLGAKGQRIAMSHHNKATKGLLARELVSLARPPRTNRGVLNAAQRAGSKHGWHAELNQGRLDIVLQ
jgi:uncharacterized protein